MRAYGTCTIRHMHTVHAYGTCTRTRIRAYLGRLPLARRRLHAAIRQTEGGDLIVHRAELPAQHLRQVSKQVGSVGS